MECFDGAEVYVLVSVNILHLLRTLIRKENVGLYSHDELGILQNSVGPEIEWKRKQIIQIFKSCGIIIKVKTNLKAVDFLDVRLDLINHTYKPYQKPNSKTVYINKHSNHPPNYLKQTNNRHFMESGYFWCCKKQIQTSTTEQWFWRRIEI